VVAKSGGEVLEILLDRREASRGIVDAEATCQIGDEAFIGVARNLSEEGLFIETSWSPSAGNKVEVDLAFRGYPVVLRLRGEVARVERDGARGIGIRLVGLDAAARDELRQWFSTDR
jgi:hypothetical protein